MSIMKTHLEVVRILGIILVDLLAEQGDWISDKQVSQMTSQLLVHTWGVMSRIRWSLNIVSQVCESHYMQRHDECTIHIIRILLLEMYTAWLCGDRKWDRWVKYGFTITTHTNTHTHTHTTSSKKGVKDVLVHGQINVVVTNAAWRQIAVNGIIARLADPKFIFSQRLGKGKK